MMFKKLKRLVAGAFRESGADDALESGDTAVVKDEVARSDQLNPFDVGLWDDMASGWYRNEDDEMFAGFHVGADDIVLDVGCGDGGRSMFCAVRGCHIIYSDIDADKVSHTGQRLQGSAARCQEGIVSDSDPLPLADGLVSRVIATEIIEHIDDPARFLEELVRVGRPGALYLLTVPGASGERAQMGFAAPQYFQKPNHIHIMDEDEFSGLVSAAGLEVVSHSAHGFFWTLWWMFFWSSGQPQIGPPWTEVLDQWTRTWIALRETPQGPRVKEVLDEILPKSQVIVARKPGLGC